MAKRRHKQVIKWKPKPETVKIFEEGVKNFPNCVGTYPDCPESVDVAKEPCSKCPVFLESPKKKRYLRDQEI